jgi:hypothetical protein
MALKHGKVNPLNVLGMRRVEKIPDHFQCIRVENSYRLQEISRWIFSNLNGRYGIAEELTITANNSVVTRARIGFEEAKEISLFMLTCPYLDTKN